MKLFKLRFESLMAMAFRRLRCHRFSAFISVVTFFLCLGTFIWYRASWSAYYQRYNIATQVDLEPSKCSSDYLNDAHLPQNHPCVISIIREQFLHKPSSSLSFRFRKKDYSEGQVPYLLNLLQNKEGGFFVECGAANGKTFSNSLFLERFKKWTGLLIEANPTSYKEMMEVHRKARTLPVCLSLHVYPTKVQFVNDGLVGRIKDSELNLTSHQEVQCFPVYSILQAVGRVSIDLFILDVEGSELDILKTIPWNLVDIKMLMIESDLVPGGKFALVEHMERNGYRLEATIRIGATDLIFVKRTLLGLF